MNNDAVPSGRPLLVLTVGTEGGALNVYRFTIDGEHCFRADIDERTLASFDESLDPAQLFRQSDWLSWEQVLELLDRDSCWHMYPQHIHPEVAQPIARALAVRAINAGARRTWDDALARVGVKARWPRRRSVYPPPATMTVDSRLSPKDRRTVLKQLPRARLAELTAHFELEVTDKRSVDAHVDAIVRKRSLDFRGVLEQLRREELQEICRTLGHSVTGREKATLIDRIVGVEAAETRTSRAAPSVAPVAAPTASPAAGDSVRPPPSARGAAAGSDSALKSLLRRFVVETAAEYTRRDAGATFVPRLLGCFGWSKETAPPGAEMPAAIAVVDGAKRTTREVALRWPERRLLVEVTKHDVMLDYAWKELLRVCLQCNPVPHYVVLTNQRDLHLYDLGRDRETPRLSIAVDDLPKYSEAFPFLLLDWSPGMTPTVVDVSKVSAEVAELVAKLYRSLKEQHAKRESAVVQFTLQCILTMFAEDIGLLPREHFTSLLYEGTRHGDPEKRLAELFRLMATKDLPSPREVAYFNGGLFTHPVTLPLGEAQLRALTKASEANWKYVDPHIFGSVFQGIMNAEERHRSGAHYTAHEDIMRVVGPTIVDPWRKRIQAASTLSELTEVRKALLSFRVLDPACGSGNFLYIAFRELYKLDTELLARIREFPSTQGKAAPKISWAMGIQTTQFHGIDINPFAVELAKVTLNIAKKIAFDERRESAALVAGQIEMEVDPSLPLDNLDKNIVCADALFTEWPEVDAIVGNPPFLGGSKIRQELGQEYLEKLQAYAGEAGVVDLACYWFRRAHDRLREGARAGLVATSGVRVGKAREASLDYVVANGGTITNAVSSRPWPGEAAVNVSMVNWVRGAVDGPHELIIDASAFSLPRIATHLQLHPDVSEAKEITLNAKGRTEGVNFGHEAFRSGSADFPLSDRGRWIRPVATGDDILRGKLATAPEYCVYLDFATEDEARANGGLAFEYLEQRVFPVISGRAGTRTDANIYASWIRRWWQPWAPRTEFFSRIALNLRVLVIPLVAARPVFVFLSAAFIPNNTLAVFAFDDDYSFGILQSTPHWSWTKAKGGKVSERIRYTNEVWTTFAWPQEPTEAEVVGVADAGRQLRRVREELMKANGWSLRTLYQAAEVAGPHPLKDAQAALDQAVRAAYAMPDGQDSTEFLLELNGLVAEDEAMGRVVQGPGVPRGLDPKDPRWNSTDCIEPPKP